jgi:hypothetical protein
MIVCQDLWREMLRLRDSSGMQWIGLDVSEVSLNLFECEVMTK